MGNQPLKSLSEEKFFFYLRKRRNVLTIQIAMKENEEEEYAIDIRNEDIPAAVPPAYANVDALYKVVEEVKNRAFFYENKNLGIKFPGS